MKMTRLLIIAACIAGNLLASGMTGRAQNATNPPPPPPPAGSPPPGASHAGPGMRRGPNFDMMGKQLGLTEEQMPKFRSIMETRLQKMRALPREPDFASLSPDERRARIMAIQDETAAQMKALLTPGQFDQWQQMGPGMHGHRVNPPLSPQKAEVTNAPVPMPSKAPQITPPTGAPPN